MRKLTILLLLSCLFTSGIWAQESSLKIALLKYNGGGDWYANPTSLPNLIKFCNNDLGMDIAPDNATIEVGSPEIYNYPFLHMTGHGNVVFSNQDVLRGMF